MVPDRPRPAGLPDARQAPPLGFVLVGLHPHQHADQIRDPSDRPAPTPSIMSTGHPAGTGMDPGGRARPNLAGETHRFTAAKRHQDPLNEQVGPAEAGVPPRDVICVHHGRARNGVLQPCRQRGLPRWSCVHLPPALHPGGPQLGRHQAGAGPQQPPSAARHAMVRLWAPRKRVGLPLRWSSQTMVFKRHAWFTARRCCYLHCRESGDGLPSKIIPHISRVILASGAGPLPRCQRAGKLTIGERRAAGCAGGALVRSSSV